MKYRHLVITRLTIKLFYDRFSPEWLEERLRLFRTYCVPSMAEQTSDAHEWIVLCDETTDPGFIREVEESRAQVPQLRVVYTSKERDVHIPDALSALIGTNTEVLITTRLDGDDSLHAGALAAVQDYAGAFAESSNRSWVLDFPLGYRYDERNRRLYEVFWMYSPFATLFEKLRPGKKHMNVYRNHHRLHLFSPAHFDLSIPAWLQVIHGRAEERSGTAISSGNRDSAIRDSDFEVDPAEVGGVFGVDLEEGAAPSR
jgi:Putative rhamnosyl transferase